MKVNTILKTEGSFLESARAFLGNLLKLRIIGYMLVRQEISHGRTLLQTLVKDPANLEGANPFSPIKPMNSATIVSQLIADKPGKKLGVVLKPCEIRALIELVKLGQAALDDLFQDPASHLHLMNLFSTGPTIRASKYSPVHIPF